MLSQRQQDQVAHVLEHDAQVISDTQLEELLKGKPPAVQDEIIDINTEARHDALQIALIVPLLAALIGFLSRVPHDAATRPEALGSRGDGAGLDACSPCPLSVPGPLS